MNLAAQAVVLLAGVLLAGAGVAWLLRPKCGEAFLSRFAQSLRAHLLEMAARIVLGAALLAHAPRMAFGPVFEVFGWVLLLTSAALLLMPWRWHQRFAGWAVPFALRRLPLVAAGNVLIGIGLVAGSLLGPD